MTYTKCEMCKQPFSALNVFSVEGAKETQISGLCEACFDSLFADDEEDYEE
jgi:hypothetical protein